MNVAIVGCGSIADSYAEGIAGEDRLSLVAAADLDRDRARRLVAEHGEEGTHYGDAAALLSDEDVSLLVNLTPPSVHADITEAALRAGRHVYTEKPLATSADRARELVELAADRDRRLGCAPVAPFADPWLVARRYLAERRLGDVGVVEVTCHLGRPSEWHDDPDTVLRTGPLLDGAVYPMTLLTAWFGPVERVETAAADHLIPDAPVAADERPPDHLTATLSFASGPRVDVTASHYVRHRTDRFYAVEAHGQEGALYVADPGAMSWSDVDGAPVRFARSGRSHRPVPLDRSPTPRYYADGVAELAAAVREDRRPYVDGRHGAHVVAVADAVREAADGGPVAVPDCGFAPRGPPPGVTGANGERLSLDGVPPGWTVPDGTGTGDVQGNAGDEYGPDRPVVMPPVGFGCSRLHGDEYVDLPIADALDCGYRLFDGAELYGNEYRLGAALDHPGSPDREAVFLVSKVWNTNHRPADVRRACRGSLAELGADRLDCYMLHWPEAWAHTEPLDRLAERPPEERDRITFPTNDEGERRTADVSLAETWAAMESLHEDGLARTLGICNVSVEQLRSLCAAANVQPSVVQVECHPYRPREELVGWCHARGIQVMAYSPVSAAGLLDDPAVLEVAADNGVSPATAVLRWHVERGVVPIPSTTDAEHLTENRDVFAVELDAAERERLDGLARASPSE